MPVARYTKDPDMPALRELQTDMINRLTQNKAEGRESVYRNNVQLILRDVLRGVYPVTTLLLGDEYMNQSASAFIRQSPPQSGDMNGYGSGFADFLDRLPGLKDYLYVPDVARLEWLAHESYLSPRFAPLTAEELSVTDDPLQMKLFLQPHLYLLRSGWPVARLWSAITEKGADLAGLTIVPEECFAIVYRENDKVVIWSISEGGYVFLENLQQNASFALAAEAALRAEPDMALDVALAQLVQSNLFTQGKN